MPRRHDAGCLARQGIGPRHEREVQVRRVLLLNITYEPLTTVGLHRAVCLVIGEKAERDLALKLLDAVLRRCVD